MLEKNFETDRHFVVEEFKCRRKRSIFVLHPERNTISERKTTVQIRVMPRLRRQELIARIYVYLLEGLRLQSNPPVSLIFVRSGTG